MEGDDLVGVVANDESNDESVPSDKRPAKDPSWVDVSDCCPRSESDVFTTISAVTGASFKVKYIFIIRRFEYKSQK